MGQNGSVYTGKTLDEAVRKGLEALGLSRAQVMIKTIEEGTGGFLGLGARPYKVQVTRRPGGAPLEPEMRGRRGGSDGARGRGGRSERGGRSGRGGRGRSDRPERGRRSERQPAAERNGRTEVPDSEPVAASADTDSEARKPRRRGRRGGRGRRGERRGSRPEEAASIEPQEAAVSEVGVDAPVAERTTVEAPAAVEQSVAPVAENPSEETMSVRSEDSDASEVSERPRRPVRPGRSRDRRGSRSSAAVAEASDAPASDLIGADELSTRAREATETLLAAMGFEAKVVAKADGDRVDVTAEVPSDDELLTGHKGEVRQALQHLLNRKINRGEGSRYHLQLEINDFWQQREEELRDIAQSLAKEAVDKDDEVVTEYLNSQERRIIHVTLREDESVKTYALGTGLIKRVAIAPADFPEGEDAEG
jgi:predicted RNA-binding protein Jag